MSEQISSDTPVLDLLGIEKKVEASLQILTDASARKAVRQQMELWMSKMNDPKIAQVYKEELGELDPEIAKQDLLNQIGGRFPGVAKDLGWDPRAAQQSFDVAA